MSRVKVGFCIVFVLIAGLFAVVGCSPSAEEIRRVVQSEVAKLELPPGPQGEQGPQGAAAPRGQEASRVPREQQVPRDQEVSRDPRASAANRSQSRRSVAQPKR